MFERRRKAVTDCHDAVSAMAQATSTLVKKIMAQVHEVTKQESIPLFAMLPKPNSEAFAIMAVSLKPGIELEKARWHYDTLYNIGTPLERALQLPTQAQFHLKQEMEKTSAMRTTATTIKGLFAQEKRDAKIFKDLLRRDENAARVMDKFSELGEERFEVDGDLRRRFDAPNKQAEVQMVNKAWKAAEKGWGKPDFQDTAQGKQLRMLRVLQRSEIIKPVLGAWKKVLRARTELRDCCSK